MNPLYTTVAARAGHRCEYCQAPEAVFNFPFEVEHIVPPVRGGADAMENLALACRSCNLFKSDCVAVRVDHATDTCRLFDPRRDVWSEHFTVDLETGVIRGMTTIGRATIQQLRMNSANQTTARRQWTRLGLFPRDE